MVLSKSFRVWRKYRPRSVLLESRDVPDHVLLFESDVIASLTPVEVEILKKEAYTDSIAAYGTLGVLMLDHEQDPVQYLVLVTGCQSVGKVKDAEVFRLTQATFVPLNRKAKMEYVQEVGKLLASGQFYFAHPSFGATFDLLSCAQKQGMDQPHFYWNRSLTTYLQRFGVDISKWLFRVMCGHVEIQTVYAGDKQARLCIFSRLSSERAGTRFNVRGINDDGHVANFVETEQAIYLDSSVASFVQIRGLVPLFWEQPGLQTGGGMIRIRFSRGYTCSQPVFERHFEWCLIHYGPTLCLNLLGSRDAEMILTNAFQEHLNQLSSAYCAEMCSLDYHHTCRGVGSNLEATLTKHLLPLVQDFKNAHGFYTCSDGQPGSQQTGTIRTNCLDCLDRTNSVQSFLGIQMVLEQLTSLGLPDKSATRFKQLLSQAWFRNGDSLSRLYSGTRALKFESKNKLKDGARSVQRTIRSNFMDGNKQEAIDMLLLGNSYSGELGRHCHAFLEKSDLLGPVPFRRELCERWSEYTTAEKLRVAVATWNVNGGNRIRSIALKHQSLSDWLLDGPLVNGDVKLHPEEYSSPPDIYAIGFEELVGLTASNIVSASSSNRREWGAELQKVLSRDTPYELLTAEQLVGVCLYIFINPKLIPYIRDVAVRTVKTGMSGKAGNKGGVAIRFQLHATSLCFVCSHFAAHQTKVLERNQDYADICKKISFPHGQTIDTHDYVFWCGDLNYRIDLPTTLAKDHIANGRWEKMHRQDQLCKQKKLNKVFQGYCEGELNFAPTYKYDEFSDDYDTSEKCRTPAWCDRVLWKRKSWLTDQPRKLSFPSHRGVTSETPADLDLGLHPSDAAIICQQDIGVSGSGGVAKAEEHVWHPGRLIYYNRAELKQSDHRPVFAILEVDIYRVDPAKRSKVKEEVLQALGPPDPTVVIEEEGETPLLSAQDLLMVLKEYGEVVLVRVTEDSTIVTFKHSPSALAALSLNGQEVHGVRLRASLHSPWPPGSPDNPLPGNEVGVMRSRRLSTSVKVLTGEKLMSGEDFIVEGAEEEEEPLEFTFTESVEGEDLSQSQGESEEGLENHALSDSSHENGQVAAALEEDPTPVAPPRRHRDNHTPSNKASSSSLPSENGSPSMPRPPRPVPPRPSFPKNHSANSLSTAKQHSSFPKNYSANNLSSTNPHPSNPVTRHSPEPPRQRPEKPPPPRPSRPPPPKK